MFQKSLIVVCLVGVGAIAHSAVVFSNTIQSSSRFNPNASSPDMISFDDAIIENPTSAPMLSIKKVTFGIRRLASAGAVTVAGFASDLDWTTYNVSGVKSLGSIDLPANGAASVTQMVSFGDGSTEIARVALSDAGGGFASFAAGLRFSGADLANNGWRIVARPASGSFTGQVGLSDDVFMTYEGGVTSLVWFGGVNNSPTNLPGSFVMEIDAAPVPEPATIAVLGMGALALLRRRRK